MASYNCVTLIGNLTRDPVVKQTAGGTSVAEFGLAMNRTWFDKNANEKKEEVTFVDVTYFGKIAEVCGEYLAKGKSVLCVGRLKTDSWVDKESGQKRYKLHVIGETMTMLGGKGDGGSPRNESQPASSSASSGVSEAGEEEVPW